MIPLLDPAGFSLRTVMPPGDVATLAAQRPGFLERSIALWQSRFYARLRKRYGNSLPFGASAPPVTGTGTTPPPLALTGIPRVGSVALVLALVAAGVAGAATFQWSQDGGRTWNLDAATASSGTTPPPVTLSGQLDAPLVTNSEDVPSYGVPVVEDLEVEIVAGGVLGVAAFQWTQDGGSSWNFSPSTVATGTTPPAVTLVGATSVQAPADLVIEITTAGPLGTSVFQWSSNGGASWNTNYLTASAVPLGTTGLTAVFAPGMYATNNTYTGQGLQTSALAALGESGVSASFSAGTYTAGDLYTGQGIPTSASGAVPLPGTGLAVTFTASAGPYAADNLYTAPTPCPEVILSWLVACVTVDAYDARGANPQDPALERVFSAKETALAELKEAADSDAGLIDIPSNEDGTSAVTTGGPLGFSDSSPYAWQDRQAELGRRQDYREGGGPGLEYQGGPANNRIVGT